MDKYQIHNKLTELVGRKFHFLEEYIEKKTPFFEIDPEGWKDKYIGRIPEGLPPTIVICNRFRPEVDQFVASIMHIIDEKNECPNSAAGPSGQPDRRNCSRPLE